MGRSRGDLWEGIGCLEEDECRQLLTRLFVYYEKLLARDPENLEAMNFFRNLDTLLRQTTECNLNRR